jgi:hypothetical protein
MRTANRGLVLHLAFDICARTRQNLSKASDKSTSRAAGIWTFQAIVAEDNSLHH